MLSLKLPTTEWGFQLYFGGLRRPWEETGGQRFADNKRTSLDTLGTTPFWVGRKIQSRACSPGDSRPGGSRRNKEPCGRAGLTMWTIIKSKGRRELLQLS